MPSQTARFVLLVILFIMLTGRAPAQAGGTCILRPEPIRLRSDVVNWAIELRPGAECVQGLRWSTLLIDQVVVMSQPKFGRIAINGPSFHYIAGPSKESDTFQLLVKGSALRVPGETTIEATVQVSDAPTRERRWEPVAH
ncbi:hypothetical protein [Bradyrhizobium sp.]|jgi:hypothetical protein|uniref:hypothetical protein n=1 Tax=Bradyrhizobium sp. TaxID=376 RepID=UPI002DDD2221|nr:hypothetical protein [Bradyrhizobium sp.]HEV2154455.1 hypothetical protein [Bradyrhizobium sp.]